MICSSLLLLLASTQEPEAPVARAQQAPSFAVGAGADLVAPTRGIVPGYPLLGAHLSLDARVIDPLCVRFDVEALTTIAYAQPARVLASATALFVLPIDSEGWMHALGGAGGELGYATYGSDDTFSQQVQVGTHLLSGIRTTFSGFFIEGTGVVSFVTAPLYDAQVIFYPGARLSLGWSI